MATGLFHRLATGPAEVICTVVAFVFAATIFVAAAWQGLRMERRRASTLSDLPFSTPTPASGHDRSTETLNR